MGQVTWKRILLGTAAGILALTSQISQGVQLTDGTVYFDRPPSLKDVSTTFDAVHAWSATYFFTLTLPEEAGEPLQRLTVQMQEGLDRRLRYHTNETQSFEGTRWDRGASIALGAVTHDRETQTLSVTFDPPVPPGTTFTIGFRPVRNPKDDGVYLFGVTAFPAGDRSYGQFLGYGRLHFYDSDNGSF